MLRLVSPHAMLYTEMIVTGALIHGDADHFLTHTDDAPCGVQLGGSDPDDLARCARLVEDYGYEEVNLNVGCPSDRVQYNRIGACLMAEPQLVAECFRSMQAAVDIPVTIKTRIGIDDRDDYDFFRDFIGTVADAGCRTFMIHARKAILDGLSPKDNRNVPPLKYHYVERIKADFLDREFILNGGIDDAAAGARLLDTFDGIMLGRAAYHRPMILSELESLVFNDEPLDVFSVLDHYRTYMEQQLATGEKFKHMAKHLLGFFAGERGARRFRRYLSENMFREDAELDVLDHALALVQPERSLARAG
ncbi:MAG: tRNA dihydrouridine(20/20a) synthase DusA [Pseudomonadales bacterium]|nr:tRNA dihydrouridine(20/20a) synthase DusA [Pseudomonadales bacterium]